MNIIFNYSFYIVAIGIVLLAISSSLVGSLNVYKGQSLIADALGHASFSGIVLAFMLFRKKNTLFLLLGAALSISLAYYLISYSNKKNKNDLNSNLAIYLSGFFGLGLALKSFIQGNSDFSGSSQAGLGNFIFGQAAYMLKEDVYFIGLVFLICVSIFLLFYKEYKVLLFDKEFAEISNIPVRLLEALQLFMTILVIAVGVKSVGVVLISSFLIMPNIAASQWKNRYYQVLILSSIFSVIAAFAGTYLSTVVNDLPTGPSVIIILGIFCGLSFVLGRKVKNA
ncbi:metal ABC transporter permease [Helcococcus kunzii]|uniref:metal ABC transporter permease n=1 Tax=Helcococcus kunzii TaxID=40091 RepID=UPI001C97C9A1|nr:metal ABC transporter permease [Helcococcus kunzii]QZO76775.1 metal ABC transporter permease [Helcococcus kunzii]